MGAEKTWCAGVDSVTGAGDECHYARSHVRVGEGYNEEFEVKENLYANDLVIIAESLEECVRRLLTWKEAIWEKGLRVNAGKTKIMICGMGLDLLQSSGEFPCAVCHT